MQSFPNFLIIGAAKCGTTTLYHYLNSHPDIFMSEVKEIRFFNADDSYSKGLDYYSQHFANNKGESRIGEASHQYSQIDQFPNSAERIQNDLGLVDLVYVVRHPIERIESAWKQVRFSHPELTTSFNDDLLKDSWYLGPSLYWKQASHYLKYWPKHKIHIVFLEDLKQHPQHELKKIYNFLNVDPSFSDQQINKNHKPSSSRRIKTGLGQKMHNWSYYHTLSTCIPQSMKNPIRRLFSTSGNQELKWKPSTYEQVLSEVKEDSQYFLSFCQKPSDYWRFD